NGRSVVDGRRRYDRLDRLGRRDCGRRACSRTHRQPHRLGCAVRHARDVHGAARAPGRKPAARAGRTACGGADARFHAGPARPLVRGSHTDDRGSGGGGEVPVSSGYIWAVIVGMAVVNYAVRYPPIAVLSRLELPEWLRRWLSYIPV